MRSMFRGVFVVLVPTFLTMGVGTAMATETPTWLCVPEKAGQTVTSGGSEGKCEAKNTTVELPPTAELATLQSILPDIRYVASGVAGKPTIQFDAVNVQVVSGSGSTNGTVNGEGNLVIGYDETTENHVQTGSNNLILGSRQGFTSYGDLVAGENNVASGSFSFVAGANNTVSGSINSVSGGVDNTASNSTTAGASVSGGYQNTASGWGASVSGGDKNSATTALFAPTWVGGGYKNTVTGKYASIFGGKELVAEKEYEAIP